MSRPRGSAQYVMTGLGRYQDLYNIRFSFTLKRRLHDKSWSRESSPGDALADVSGKLWKV